MTVENANKQTYAYRRGLSPNTLSVISAKNRVFAANSSKAGINGLKTQVGVMSQFDPSENRSVETVRGIGFGDRIAELVPGATEPMSISVVRTAQYLENSFQAFGFKGGVDGYVRSLRHHRWPFDVRQELVMSEMLAASDAFGTKGATGLNGLLTDTNFGKGTSASLDYNGSAMAVNYLEKASAVQYTDGAGQTASTGAGRIDANDNGSWAIDDSLAIVTVYEACWFTDFSSSFSSDSALVQENCTLQVTDVVASEGLTFSPDFDAGASKSQRTSNFYNVAGVSSANG